MESKKLNAFSSLHPLVLMIYFLSVIVVAMFSVNPLILLLALLGSMSFFAMLQDLKSFFFDLAFYIPMFLMITIINSLFSHNGVTPLFFMNGNPVTLEAILYGGDIALMLVGVIYWCKCYSIVMTTDKFLFLFGKAIPKLSLIMSMALRFIPLFKEKFKEIKTVQSTVGLFSNKGFVNKINSQLKVFSALATWSLENSVDTALSMKARGYGLKGRTHFSIFKFRKRDGVTLAVLLILFAVVLTGMITNVTDFAFYPEITELKLNLSSIIVYIAFGGLSFIPFITEVWEVIVWKYLISKI